MGARGRLFLFCLSSVACLTLHAAPTFEVPPLTGPVVDQAQLLSEPMRERLGQFLHQLYESGGTQIEVVTVPTLGGVSIEEAGIVLADRWKLGRQGADTGVILLVAASERKVRIEVGKGREGDLPDLTASRIIREQIAPRLHQGDYDGAIKAGVLSIVHSTDPDFALNPREQEPRVRHGSGGRGLLMLFILIFFILPLLFRGGGGGGGGGFLAGALLGNLLGGGGRGGSGGGGGWSGGGGGFSGGGSSGDW